MFSSLFRYTLRCLVAVNKEASCVQTIQSTEEKLAEKKKALEAFQVCFPDTFILF